MEYTKEISVRPWINSKIIDLIEERRKLKNVREAKRIKDERLNNICANLFLTKSLSDKVYTNIKQFFSEFMDRTTMLKWYSW